MKARSALFSCLNQKGLKILQEFKVILFLLSLEQLLGGCPIEPLSFNAVLEYGQFFKIRANNDANTLYLFRSLQFPMLTNLLR